MAKYERRFKGNFDEVLKLCKDTIEKKSLTASLEDQSYFENEKFKASVSIFERFSYRGSNRVSLSITLIESDEELFISAITSGGSQDVFSKVNAFGEVSFLETLIPAVEEYIKKY
ncbi:MULTISPECIES: DUF6054 family protein [Peptoniphilus]|uniref:DUF6054 family protein n=1 Tax=Peptoniphilus TaxID=162289 RepID=UPI0001DA9A75|nr:MULTISPECIES: DUF6054 family protein [Peptoniphilus]EFI41935.1 hypothetical protein HMPREF0629_00566 [Peptoniphilus sp. oral taxon 386 str. F0131]